MPGGCRFVHASDLHLERVPSGVAELSETLKPVFSEAAYRAAGRVFDAVLEEEADFLLLVGDVLDASATGPRGPLFLIEQMGRLAQRRVAVYWLLAGVDRAEDWPPGLRLPENVHRLRLSDADELVIESRGEPLARLRVLGDGPTGNGSAGPRPVGGPAAPALSPPELRHLPLIVAHYGAVPSRIEPLGAAYVAWGGLHTRQTLSDATPLVHSCGTPQGRSGDETGAHGATLVELSASGKPQLGFIPTDALRWHRERLVLEESHGRADFERLARQRIATLTSGSSRPPLVVEWTLIAPATSRHWSRWRRQLPELLEWLREQFGQLAAPVWSLNLELEPPAQWPSTLLSQETMLAEFLRELTAQESGTATDWDLAALAGQRPGGTGPPWRLDLAEPTARGRVARRAAALGVELLSGEERDR